MENEFGKALFEKFKDFEKGTLANVITEDVEVTMETRLVLLFHDKTFNEKIVVEMFIDKKLMICEDIEYIIDLIYNTGIKIYEKTLDKRIKEV